MGFEFKTKSASEMLEKIHKEASPDDIVGEYLWFLKSVPKLLNNQMSDLVHLVKTELDVGNNERKLCLHKVIPDTGRTVVQDWNQSAHNNCTTDNEMHSMQKRTDTKSQTHPSSAPHDEWTSARHKVCVGMSIMPLRG